MPVTTISTFRSVEQQSQPVGQLRQKSVEARCIDQAYVHQIAQVDPVRQSIRREVGSAALNRDYGGSKTRSLPAGVKKGARSTVYGKIRTRPSAMAMMLPCGNA